MSKVALFMMISLDGYFERKNHGLDWHNVDEEFQKFAIEQLGDFGTLLFGRKTYDMMADFWTQDHAREIDPLTAELMNTSPKVVFSNSLQKADWQNTRLLKGNLKTNVADLLSHSKKDLLVLGSSNLCVSLLQNQILSELRIMVNPVVLGSGNSLFNGLSSSIDLALENQRIFKSGNILLTYKVKY